jgi:hypothetical protein
MSALLPWFEGTSTVWMTTALLLVAANASSSSTPVTATVSTPAVAGDAKVAGSTNFAVYSNSRGHDAREVAARCELWRERLQGFWCGGSKTWEWTPRCQIVIHATKNDYLTVVGAGAAQTLGTSSIEFTGSRVKVRRIDLLGGTDKALSALAHEMTHVLFADLFQGRQPPRWVDEGVAILADDAAKQQLHQRDLHLGMERRCAFRCAELLTLDDYPSPERIPAFYGQSASLVAFLARRDDPARFVTFVERAMKQGYDRALRDVYHIDGLAQMETLWHASHRTTSAFDGMQLTLDTRAAVATPVSAE